MKKATKKIVEELNVGKVRGVVAFGGHPDEMLVVLKLDDGSRVPLGEKQLDGIMRTLRDCGFWVSNGPEPEDTPATPEHAKQPNPEKGTP